MANDASIAGGVAKDKQAELKRLEVLQQLADFGRMNANLLHDISNPLTAAALCLQEGYGKNDSSIQRARRNIETLQRYVSAAREQIRASHDLQAFDINDEFERLKDALYPLAAQQSVALRFTGCRSLVLQGNPVKFQQIITNLVVNAIEASANGGSSLAPPLVAIQVSVPKAELVITVRDKGAGIPADTLPHIFDPFYSTKRKTEVSGLGLGLYAAKHSAETVFNGTIEVKSNIREGTTFIVKLPRSPRLVKHNR